jgi:hypothetical protein
MARSPHFQNCSFRTLILKILSFRHFYRYPVCILQGCRSLHSVYKLFLSVLLDSLLHLSTYRPVDKFWPPILSFFLHVSTSPYSIFYPLHYDFSVPIDSLLHFPHGSSRSDILTVKCPGCQQNLNPCVVLSPYSNARLVTSISAARHGGASPSLKGKL